MTEERGRRKEPHLLASDLITGMMIAARAAGSVAPGHLAAAAAAITVTAGTDWSGGTLFWRMCLSSSCQCC